MLLWQNFLVLQMLRLLYFVYQSIAIDTWLHKKKAVDDSTACNGFNQ